MPNIHQQKKRVRIAERQERPLPLDRAAYARASCATCPPRATRTPSRPRIAISSGGSTAPSRAVRCTGTPPPAARRRQRSSSQPTKAADLDERTLELELVRQCAAALQRDVELGQPHERSCEPARPSSRRPRRPSSRKLATPLETLRRPAAPMPSAATGGTRSRARRDRRASTRCRSACRRAVASAARR